MRAAGVQLAIMVNRKKDDLREPGAVREKEEMPS